MSTIEVNLSEQHFAAIGVDPMTPFEIIDVNQLISRDACITQVTAKIQNDVVVATGTSRRHPGDKANADIGKLLSYSRAFENLARKIRKRANGLVDQQAHNAAQRPAQLEKAAAWKANPIVRIASEDSRVQVAALGQLRQAEGSWTTVNDQISGSDA